LRLISIKAALTWSMSNLVFPAQILTEDCKFKKLALNLCTFTNRVDLRGVDVEETDIRGTDFEKRIVMPSSHKCFGKLANRETANLLKDQALLRNNRIEAVYYHQKEKWYHLKETFPKNVTEWVPNFFNLVTNGYGVNWWLPLPFILLFSLLVYPFCLWLGGGVEWVGFGEGFGAYLSNSLLFLVAPRITVMELGGLPKEALSPFVFYLSRGLLAILYYQLIQAFRRNKPL